MYVVIVGCGRVGSQLAKLLTSEGHDVVVVDKDEPSFSRLGDAFNGITLKGSGVSTKVLQEAGIERADIFCSLTNSDNVNIMACQVARGIFKVPRVIARVYDTRKASMYKALGLNILSGSSLFASMLRDKITDPMLSGYLIESSEMGVLEFPVPENYIGKTVAEINIPHESIAVVVKQRGFHAILPDPTTVLAKGDIVVSVVRMTNIKNVKKALNI
jgi:trk system potassium uptake protein TrkA